MANNKGSYVPEIAWKDHLAEVADRYPYQFPPRLEKGPHPKAGDCGRVPGGLPRVKPLRA